MGEHLFTGATLTLIRLVGESEVIVASMPELEWEREGAQLVPLLHAAFERINEIPAGSDADDDAEYPRVIELLQCHDACFGQLRLFSMADMFQEHLNAELIGIGFGIDEQLANPLNTTLYWGA